VRTQTGSSAKEAKDNVRGQGRHFVSARHKVESLLEVIGTARPTIYKISYGSVTDGLNSHEFSATDEAAVQISSFRSFCDQRLDTESLLKTSSNCTVTAAHSGLKTSCVVIRI
jgi:hypothetical protein